MVADLAKAAAALFVAALVQVTALSPLHLFGSAADLTLVALVAFALLRGSVLGALAGFWAGLVLDTALLAPLGLSSLLLTLVGYWIGRYGETTVREPRHAALLASLAATVLYAVTALALHVMLRDSLSAREVLVETLPGALLLNLLLILPVLALCRRLLRLGSEQEPVTEVQLFG